MQIRRRALFILAIATLLPAVTLSAGSARADTAVVVRYEIENNQLKVPAAIVFETGSDKLKPESDAALNYVKGYLDDKSYISLMRVEVHTDSQGDDGHNQTLSEKRAAAVVRALIARGIDCKRLLAVGFGENKPVADNATLEGRAANRRTVFANAALRGRPIGGMPVDGGGKVAGDACK